MNSELALGDLNMPSVRAGLRSRKAGRIVKKARSPRLKARAVVSMMAVMQDSNAGEVPKEFLETGRTGRRNAMPDILHPPDAQATTADLPAMLQQLSTEQNAEQPSTSRASADPGPSTSTTESKDDKEKPGGS